MGVQMAEYVAHAVLRYFRRFDEYEKQARRGIWAPLPLPDKREFTIGVLGMGMLGSRVLETMGHFGFPLRGWSRTQKQVDGVELLCRHRLARRIPGRHAGAGVHAAADARDHQPARPRQAVAAAARAPT